MLWSSLWQLIYSARHAVKSKKPTRRQRLLGQDGIQFEDRLVPALTLPTDIDGVTGGSVSEGVSNGSTVGITAFATGSGAVSYSLANNAGGRFAINSTTGVVTVAGASLLTDNASYSVQIQATDSGSTTSQNFNIAVTNANPSLSVSGPTSGTEGSAVTYTATVTDPANTSETLNDAISYTWSVTKNGSAYGSNASGTITTGNASGLATIPSFSFVPDDNGNYAVTLAVTDGDSGSSQSVTSLAVSNANPTITVTAPTESTEGTELKFKATVTDPANTGSALNDVMSYTWSVTKDGSAFGTDVSGSVATGDDIGVAAIPQFGFVPDDNGSYVVTLSVTDGDDGASQSKTTIAVTNVNPTATFDVVEASDVGFAFSVAVTKAADMGSLDIASLKYSFATSAAGLATTYANAATANAGSLTISTIGEATVYARVFDKDGGFVDLTDTIDIRPYVTFNTASQTTLVDSDASTSIEVKSNATGQIEFYRESKLLNIRDSSKVLITAPLFSKVTRITVDARGGDDSIQVFVPTGLLTSANLIGGEGNDNLIGSLGADTLTGGLGNDSMNGGSGSDRIVESGDVNFTLSNTSLTGVGTDVLAGIEVAILTGGASANTFNVSNWTGTGTLNASAGTDTITATTDTSFTLSYNALSRTGRGTLTLAAFENAQLTGGAAANSFTLSDWTGSATIQGAAGTDRMITSSNNNFVFTGSSLTRSSAGTFTLSSVEEAKITAGSGNNILDSRQFTGRVTMDGGLGDDRLYAGVGESILYGGSGNDFLDATTGKATLSGGYGNDSLYGGSADGILRGDSGNDSIRADFGKVTIEGGAGNDSLYGSNQSDVFRGGTGDDAIYGWDGNDTMIGDAGNDSIYGGNGNDYLYGSDGNDFIVGDAGNDLLKGDAGNDTLNGAAGDDTLSGGTGNDQLFGSIGNDRLYGDDGNDTLDGGSGNDSLYGGKGVDSLKGDVGDDYLEGGIDGVADIVSGGGDNDTFKREKITLNGIAADRDEPTDFNSAFDTLL